MTQYRADGFQVHAFSQQPRRAAVPQVVKAHMRKLCIFEQPVKDSFHVARINCRSPLGRKN